LQCVAVCCSALQCVAVLCSLLIQALQRVPVVYIVLLDTATRCNKRRVTLQHAATRVALH